MATLSLWALYQYDKTIFDDMVLPSSLNKEVFCNNLIMEAAELEILYADADFLKRAIKYWSESRIYAWNRMERVLYEEYDPFVNIKRDEMREIVQDRNLQTKNDGSNTLNTNAWNSSSAVEREQQIVDNTTKDTGKIVTTEHFHVEGDSAITDAQDVARKEMELRIKYDLYRYILNDFKRRFCLLVY